MRALRGAGGARLVSREVVGTLERARALVAEAEAERGRILARSAEEAEGARERAYREGAERARAEAAAWMTAKTLRWSEALEAEAESVVTLACEVARAVLGRESALGVTVVRDITRQTLTRVRRARRVLLRVHHSEVDRVRAEMSTWLPGGMSPELLDVEADPSVAPGGVVVDTELGQLDARIDVQLAAIRRALSQGEVHAPRR